MARSMRGAEAAEQARQEMENWSLVSGPATSKVRDLEMDFWIN